MKSNKLTIQINRSAQDIFEYTLNPSNTPKWVDSILEEKTNESPPKLGTIYKNRGEDGVWRELELTKFEPGKMFVLTSHDSGYNVRYTLTPAGDNTAELEYYEWMNKGELEELFTPEPLKKLKTILEQS